MLSVGDVHRQALDQELRAATGAGLESQWEVLSTVKGAMPQGSETTT